MMGLLRDGCKDTVNSLWVCEYFVDSGINTGMDSLSAMECMATVDLLVPTNTRAFAPCPIFAQTENIILLKKIYDTICMHYRFWMEYIFQ